MTKTKEANGSTSRKFVTLCGRIFRDVDPQYFPSIMYRGHTIRFCTDSCLDAFLADPDLFYKAHRNSENEKTSQKQTINGWRKR